MKLKRLIGIILILLALSPIFFLVKPVVFKKANQEFPAQETKDLKEASFWEALEDGRVQCQLCPNRCVLADGQWGLCKARKNIGGRLYSMVYGKTTSINVDPIEKKPFYHFLPGEKAYSLATSGCNLACQFCQNWDIAQRFPDDLQSRYMSPEEVVGKAKESGAPIIAFTYNEPIVWYEYMLDIVKLAKKQGLKTVMVSGGFINKEPLQELIPYMDAIKVDLKGFRQEYYQEIVGGKLEPILETLKILKDSGIHYEIVTLLVTGKNDSEEEIRDECNWIKENLGVEVPLHFSRFHPDYKMMNIPPTPEETVKKARKVCMGQGLRYVYTGNIVDLEGSTTFCPDNGQPLIVRKGFFVTENRLNKEGESTDCPRRIVGVWK